MQSDQALIAGLIEACREAIAQNAEHLCELDSAIGDGDHGTNMRRGCDAVCAERQNLSGLSFPEAVEKIGITLVMNIGGAAGPLYGTLLMEIGRELRDRDKTSDFATAFERAVDAVARRGRSRSGDKTLLDVLYPIHAELTRRAALADIAERARLSADRTAPMRAMRGRAAYLGDRSIGHVDPGASSCALLTAAICRYLGEHRAA
ncbi:dihydroxyacetone kinase subunit DhaL [Rhizobium sp. BK251]|uniref:dihydroxyacetone kinase subunit DhaL n=1 Tax=Rhizobium sp. BK251 TaxID=2512125 RepID=UPI001046E828|nr:dihydroxyacetone kinase subunit DhaL [Rhizobium sp. BK251]TCL65195.1 dihydroxyacetone kinase DhaL subunit [Rhizobium sp. BK251]